MEKFNLNKIVRDYHAGLDRTDKIALYVFPVLIGLSLIILKVRINSALVAIISTALSVFCALLFGLLIPVIDQARRIKERLNSIKEEFPKIDSRPSGKQLAFVRHENHLKLTEKLFANVSFSIVFSLISVILLVILAFVDPFNIDPKFVAPTSLESYSLLYWSFIILEFLCLCSTILFLLSVAMLLRRMYFTFAEEIK